jgi:hypothetical protein
MSIDCAFRKLISGLSESHWDARSMIDEKCSKCGLLKRLPPDRWCGVKSAIPISSSRHGPSS